MYPHEASLHKIPDLTPEFFPDFSLLNWNHLLLEIFFFFNSGLEEWSYFNGNKDKAPYQGKTDRH